jgi:photosystem I subunit III
MVRQATVTALLCAGAVAATTFVVLPSASRQTQLRTSSTLRQAWSSDFTESKLEAEADAAPAAAEGSFFKWLAAGVLAGVLMAVSSAPAEASFNAAVKYSPENFTIKKSKVLEPCKNNKKFAKRMKDEIYKIQARQKKYPEGSVVYNRLAVKIDGVKRRQTAYGDRFCGKKDGLPRVIATGEADVRGSVVYPGAMFLYIAGWIGWAGRSYLMRTNDENKELRIDVPLALQCMASGFSWPVAAWQDIVNGDMVVPDDKVHRSFH